VRRKKHKVSQHQLALFARQFVTMLDAGVPIHRALEFYSEGDPSDLGEIVEDVSGQVATGMSLSAAFRKYPDTFSLVFCGLIQAGEKTGELSVMIHSLAELLEQEASLASRLKSAITYPIFLAGVSFIVGCIFMYVIIPALEPMLAGLNVEPPLPTKILMFIGHFIRHPLVIVGFPLSCGLLWWFGPTILERARQNPKIGERLDWLPLRIPILGDLYQRITLARILFTIATTVESGMTLTTAIDMGRSVTSNVYFQRALDSTRHDLTDGESLGEAMSHASIFPDAMVQMISIGEETASLGPVMARVSIMYGEDAGNRIETAVQLMEPIMLFCMGMVSAFLVLAAILPLVNMIDAL
jgi:type IV pilus assembly protein PilC